MRPTRKHTAVLAEWLPGAGTRIADIGCGRGAISRVMARGGAEVVGLDPQLVALSKARAAEPVGTIRYVAAGGEALPLVARCLEAAVFFNALHHVPSGLMDTALDEAARAVKPDGRAIVVEPIAEGPQFELVRPIEDETEVRAEAYRALHRAAATAAWSLEHESEYAAPVRHESFEAWREGVIAVDPRRAEAMAALEADMRERFHASARVAEGAYWLDQPTRLTVLRRASTDADEASTAG